jgi:hypothetical protein
VFSVLFVIGWLLLQQRPPVGAADNQLLDYFVSGGGRRSSRLAGLYIVPFAGIAFIWFMAALRDRIVRAGGREHAVLAAVQLISGTVFVAAIFAVGAAELSIVWVAEAARGSPGDIDAARGIIALAAATGQIVAIRASAVFIAVSSTRAMRAGLFPRWLCYLRLRDGAGAAVRRHHLAARRAGDPRLGPGRQLRGHRPAPQSQRTDRSVTARGRHACLER